MSELQDMHQSVLDQPTLLDSEPSMYHVQCATPTAHSTACQESIMLKLDCRNPCRTTHNVGKQVCGGVCTALSFEEQRA